MKTVQRSGPKRVLFLILGVLSLSVVATLWSTLILFQSARLNKQNTTSLLPLLQCSETFEREILNARIAFIYYATINKPGSLEQGWTRYHRAEDALQTLHTLAAHSGDRSQLTPRIEALDTAWAVYYRRLQSVLSLANQNIRSGDQFDQTVGEWAANGNTLVNAARDVVTTTAILSRSQTDETGDMLSLARWIICLNGLIYPLGCAALFSALKRDKRSSRKTADSFKSSHAGQKTIPFRPDPVALWAFARRHGKIVAALSGMLILTVIVLGTGISALRGLARLGRVQAETLSSQRALLDAEAVKSMSLAAESDTRGFVFSGRRDLLVSQQNDFRQALQASADLIRDTQDNPRQQRLAQQIGAALNDRFQTLKTITAVREREGTAAVFKLVGGGHSLASKQRLLDQIVAYQSAENESVTQGSLGGDRAAARSKALILFAALPAALTLTVLAVVMAHLLTGSKRLQEQLAYQAGHDVLTGLPNRHSLQSSLDEMLEQARLDAACCAVFAIDLDHFKEVNDRFGHHVGDGFLKQVAMRLRAGIRQHDTLFRVGGDEFLCLTPGVRTIGDAELIAAKLVDILGQSVEQGGNLIHAGGSVGFAVFPEHGDNAEDLTRHADAALYMAKLSGRAQFHGFYETEAEVRLRKIRESLETGIEKKLFHLVYQPQYSTHGELRGFEALLRLTHPELGPISPGEFIPLAERNNRLMIAIGSWVLQQACNTFAEWIGAGQQPGLLSVNVSAAQLGDGFVETVVQALKSSGLPGSALELELTESTMMENLGEASRQMNLLESSQVRLAIDDFGTGFSSLHQLHHLPIATLKIDQSFVKELETDRSSLPIVSAIVALGQALSLDIVAEGVETESQRGILAKLGCHHFQGYLFARPVEKSFASAMIASSTCATSLVSEAPRRNEAYLVM